MATLTVITITLDEERNIEACLDSVRWAGERLVVDSGSSDRTAELARAAGARVLSIPWKGYGETKNIALNEAQGEWVLWLDADERVTPELAAEIRQAVARNDPDMAAYTVPRRASFLGRWILHSGWYPGRVTRLFRRSKGRFSVQRVHEGLVVDGPVGALRADLEHYTDPDLHHYFRKFNRYTTLAAEELHAAGRRFRLTDVILRPPFQFFRMYGLRLGFLDGFPGFILAVVSAGYVFVKYAKLWELWRSNR